MMNMRNFQMMGEIGSAGAEPFAGVAVFQVAGLRFSQRKGGVSSRGEHGLLDLFDAIGIGCRICLWKLPCQHLPRQD